MHQKYFFQLGRLSVIAVLAAAGLTPDTAQAYYTGPPLFHPQPKPGDKKPWNVRNFGPVGIGIDLTGPAFTMVI